MDQELSLTEHLNELRKRIIISLISLGLGTAFSLPFSHLALKVLKLPASGVIERLAFFSPQEAFLIYMRIAFLCGWILSLPVILYQLWAFVAPAVEAKIKRHAGIFVTVCSLSFIAGGIFAYFVLIPPALRFLLSFGKEELEPVISASKYISFIISLILGCGLVFQMPLLSFILSRLGIINWRFLRRKYKYALVIIFVIAAIITPTPDVFNMLLLACPMLFLYEISIWVSLLTQPKIKALA